MDEISEREEAIVNDFYGEIIQDLKTLLPEDFKEMNIAKKGLQIVIAPMRAVSEIAMTVNIKLRSELVGETQTGTKRRYKALQN